MLKVSSSFYRVSLRKTVEIRMMQRWVNSMRNWRLHIVTLLCCPSSFLEMTTGVVLFFVQLKFDIIMLMPLFMQCRLIVWNLTDLLCCLWKHVIVQIKMALLEPHEVFAFIFIVFIYSLFSFLFFEIFIPRVELLFPSLPLTPHLHRRI